MAAICSTNAWPWIELPLKGNPPELWQCAPAPDILREDPADMIHAHYRRATLVARRLNEKHRPPILYTLHQPGISLAGPRRWLSDFGDFVHVPSEEAWQWLIEYVGVPPERITLIPHGVDPARFPIPDDAIRTAARAQLGCPPMRSSQRSSGGWMCQKTKIGFWMSQRPRKKRFPACIS